MLLFYYPISKKHFEDSGEGSDSNCEGKIEINSYLNQLYMLIIVEICIDAVASPEEHMTQCNLLTGNTTCSTRRSLKMSKFAKKRKNSLKK